MEGEEKRPSFLKSRVLINPYFFGLLLIGLFFINFYNFISLDHEWTLTPIYFLTYALGQSLLEVVALIFVANVIRRFLHKSLYYLFISFCFTCFLLHYVDFILVRFMDISIFYGLSWIFDESLENFIELLHLTGMTIGTWVFILCATLFLIPLLALILYSVTSKISPKRPLKISQGSMIKTLCFIPIGLLVLELAILPLVTREDQYHYERLLPWKSTIVSQRGVLIEVDAHLRALPSERSSLKMVHSSPLVAEKRPNILLFVVESLREDFLTQWTAKNITAFKQENIHFKKTFSNANATHYSWYSIFHANYPLYWAQEKRSWKSGSLPLQALKKMGYKLHVYSAAQLKYYGLSKVMFGKDHDLADSFHVFPHYSPKEAWQSDRQAIETFLGDLDQKWSKAGNIFIFFLDSTHFNYSWPSDYPINFRPISDEKTHLRVSNSLKNIELIKNRYRNAIHYMDSLFGRVIQKLKSKKLYDDAVIIFTGDHGEEFFEEGQLFHASHLSLMQTQPPIYYKLGDNSRAKDIDIKKTLTSHIDIFPTILDYLVGEQPFFKLFHGESIFKDKRFPYVVTGRFNGPRSPEEFFIHDGLRKFTLRFFSRSQLEVRHFQDLQDRSLDLTGVDPKLFCKPVLDRLFN
ncbi:MAG: Inner membrane protein YejM, partial [Chlamydiae bacterium]|nr:Inner membrane protein YejM [Chlamydiota bacterium]